MNFKLRFALLFTVFVAIVLSVCSITIFLLYANYRETDFYDRVKLEGNAFYDFTIRFPNKKDAVVEKITQGLLTNTLYDECIAILNEKGELVDKLPDTMHFRNDAPYLSKINKVKELHYQENTRQFVCIYMPDTKYYVIASGIDIVGFGKMDNLKLILLFVFLGGVAASALFSFLFVNQAFQPLAKLSAQMQKTTELNLTDRLPEKNTKDELYRITKYFNEMLQRLNNAFELQKNFVQYASHELRTPLAVMLSQTESALNKNLSQEDFQKVLNSLKEEQLNLIELTNSLLLLSQYEKLQYSFQLPAVRIDEVVFEAIEMAKKSFTNIEVRFNFLSFPEKEEYLSIKGNDALLKAAFFNLIKNAYLYSTNKQVLIEMKAQAHEIFLTFDNEGELISGKEIKSVMMPFFRSHNSSKIKGYGLGLALVKKIIEIHHGEIQYKPVPPITNRFIVSFSK